MRKITLLLSILVCALWANAQNMVTNPSFESWTSGKPDSWTLGTTGTITQSTTTPTSSGSSLQIAATGTFSVTQVIAGPSSGFDTNTKYKVSLKYKVTAGDGTDARIWSNWITSAVNAATTTYAKMSLTDSLGLKGPGGNVQPASGVIGNGTNGYLVDNRGADWMTYSFSFYPPAGATQFSFQIRTYNTATVLWDDIYFGPDNTAAVENVTANKLSVSVSNNKLTITDAPSNAVEIFNTTGAKVVASQLINGSMNLNLAKGAYIVRSGNATAKIIL